ISAIFKSYKKFEKIPIKKNKTQTKIIVFKLIFRNSHCNSLESLKILNNKNKLIISQIKEIPNGNDK
ncbi:TPA: hypothetical protein ACQWZT_002003, partial [Streptococcus pneumoniae]